MHDMWRSRADIPRQDGRCAVVTGTGGLGYEVALAFAMAGAEVVLAGRNAEKGSDAVAKVRKVVPNANIRFERLDLASLGSVHDFAERVNRRNAGLDVLINNAGIMSPPARRTTIEGFELQFGVNYLAHFAPVDGIDLDGVDSSADMPATVGVCRHQDFIGTKGESGIDNQFYRLAGCNRSFQSGG